MKIIRLEDMQENLTKNDSLCLKGIAIVLMLFHHCFMSAERFEGFTVDFSPFSQKLVVHLSAAAKVCVPIFLFITGFGLALSIAKVSDDKINQWMKRRLGKVLFGYWFIYILYFCVTMLIDRRPVGIYLKRGMVKGLFYCMTDFLGLANLFGTPTLNSTWWYMSIAILSILFLPIIRLLDEKIGSVGLLLLSFFARRVFTPELTEAKDFFYWIPALSLGYVFARQNLFVKISSYLSNHKPAKILFYAATVVLVCFFSLYFYTIPGNQYYWIRLGFFSVAVIFLCKATVCRLRPLSDAFVFLGRYSMDIFLTHTFIRHQYLRDFTYSFKHFALIVLVLLIMSLAVAMAIGLLKKILRFDQAMNWVLDKVSGT